VGVGWQHNFIRRIVKPNDSQLLYIKRDGKRLLVDKERGQWFLPKESKDKFIAETDGFKILTGNNAEEFYGFDGKLNKIRYNDGYTIELQYDETTGQLALATDSYGISMSFNYNTDDRMASVRLSDSRVWQYAYDGAGNLTGIVNPDGTSRQYHYENPDFVHALTGITDERGNRYATYNYDSQGRAIATWHSGNAERVDVTFNADGTTTVTNSRGKTADYIFSNILGTWRVQSMTGVGCTDCGQ
jgi:YD repeat-containing protein